jgi:hypothetical protein
MSTSVEAAALLPVIKETLNYAETDDSQDGRLLDLICDGMAYLGRIAAGNVLSFAEGTAERRLLKSYCLYANSDMLDEFLPRYLHELNSFQIGQEVVAFERENEEAAAAE